MRYAININNLPHECDTGSLEPFNVHWHPQPWPANATRQYVTQAFANGVSGYPTDIPLCLDLEPIEMWDFDGALYQKYLNISTSARQRVAAVFPGREIWSYDPAGGRNAKHALANVCAARQALDGLDAAGIGMYPNAAGDFDYDTFAYLTDAYREASKRCWPHFDIIGFVTHRVGGERDMVAPKQYVACIDGAKKLGVDIIAHWQAETYFVGGTSAEAAGRIQPYIELLKEAAK